MQFIAITKEGCYLETGNDVFEFLKKFVAYHNGCDAECKVFFILLESGKMELPELIDYVNGHLVISDDEITAIYSVGAKVF